VISNGAFPAIPFVEESEGTAMQTWMGGAMLIEAMMLSFLVALWIAWVSLRGLFWMMPGTGLAPAPIRPPAGQAGRIPARHTV
jgi:hypothetical protein